MLRVLFFTLIAHSWCASLYPRPRCPRGQTYSYKLRRCKKNEPVFCIALACPPGFIRKPPSCKCVRKTPALPPVKPPKPSPPKNCNISSCYAGYFISNRCKCQAERGPTCRKGCRPGYTIRPNSCVCVPRRSCQIQTCKSGFKRNNSQCKCDPVGPSLPSPAPPAPPVTPVSPAKCYIKSCDPRYEVSKSKCVCKVKLGPTCRIGCPPGLRVFPGRCRCVRPPKCPIRSCRSGSRLDHSKCKCVKCSSHHQKPLYPAWGYDYGYYNDHYDDYWNGHFGGYSNEENSNVILGNNY